MGDVHSLIVLGSVVLFAPVFWLTYLEQLGRDVRLWLVSAFLTGFCTMFGGTFGSLMNLYLLKLGMGSAIIGGLNGAFYVGMALFAAVSGLLIRHVGGIRNAAALGMAMVALGQLAFPLPTLLGATPSLSWLTGTLLLASGGITLYAVNIWPFMASRIAPEKRAFGFAGHLGLVPVGGMVGTMLSGRLASLVSGSADASAHGLAVTLCASGALLSLGVLALLSISKKPSQGAQPAQGAAARPSGGAAPVAVIAMMVIVMIFDVSGEGIGRVFQNVYMARDLGLDSERVSVLLSYGQLVAALAVFTTPLFIARMGLAWTFILTTLGMSLGLAVVSTIPHWFAAGAGYALLIGFSQMARAAKTQYAMEIVEEQYRPHISGFMQFSETGTVFLLSLGGGYLLEHAGLTFPALFNAVALSTALAALWFWLFFLRIRRREAASAV